MQLQGGLQEIIGFIVIWLAAIVFVEAMVELLLTAEPLEEPRAWIARRSAFMAGVLSCGYCFSVWVAITLAWVLPSPILLAIDLGVTNKYLIFCEDYLWWLINGIILHRFSNIFHIKIAHQKVYDIISEDDDG